MILFPGISLKVMLRVLFPFIFSLIAIGAIMVAYIHFTDVVYSQLECMEQVQAVHTAKNLTAISMNEALYPAMYDRQMTDEFIYFELKPEFQGSFDLSEFIIVSPLDTVSQIDYPFEEDSLLRSSLETALPVLQYMQNGKDQNLLLMYPVSDSFGNTTVARMVFENVHGNDVPGSVYNIIIIAAAAIILLIIPSSFLRLADVRRQIEKKGFYQTDSHLRRESGSEINASLCPSALLDGSEFPALFRLDDDGKVIFINSAAERLIDISKEEAKGISFHELPCFSVHDGELVEYPEKDEPVEINLGFINSSGSSRQFDCRIERLADSGYAVSVMNSSMRKDDSILTNETRDSENAAFSGNLSGSDIQLIRSIIEEGRGRAQKDQVSIDQFERISSVLSGMEEMPEIDDQDRAETVEVFSELDAITTALNDVLPERVSIEINVPGFLPQVECTRIHFTQIVKNLVFYSLESKSGSVRIILGARDVPSPVSDSIFSVNCDRTVSRSVSISYTDGTRIPVVLKEALLDPETDLSGIQRDYGSHISSVAEVLSMLDCHPVFTEGSSGTTLNILFRISEDYLFDVSGTDPLHRIDLNRIKVAICEASRSIRDSVSDVLEMYGISVVTASDLDELREMISDSEACYLLLDTSVIEESIEGTIKEIGIEFPDIEIILSTGLSENDPGLQFTEPKVNILRKPYSPDDLLSIIEMTVSTGSAREIDSERTGRNE